MAEAEQLSLSQLGPASKEVEATATSASSVPGRFPLVNSEFVNHRFVLRITLTIRIPQKPKLVFVWSPF